MVSVSYELARKIATEVVSRVNARFPEVRVDVHGPTELAHGVFVVISPEDPRAVDAEVFVAYDGTYLLNAGPSFCIESDDFSGNLADVAGQIFAQLEAEQQGWLRSGASSGWALFRLLGSVDPVLTTTSTRHYCRDPQK